MELIAIHSTGRFFPLHLVSWIFGVLLKNALYIPTTKASTQLQYVASSFVISEKKLLCILKLNSPFSSLNWTISILPNPALVNLRAAVLKNCSVCIFFFSYFGDVAFTS